jgi:uncharacterized protein
MEAIHIPQLLKLPENTETLQLQEFIPGLETLTPVRGQLAATHRKTYLEVKVKAETIVTLCCDRCLQHYNHRILLDTTELLWLEDSDPNSTLPFEQDGGVEDLSETLSPQGYFQPDLWLYEQLCLALPVKQLCSSQCPGISLTAQAGEPQGDSRWASLKALKDRMPQ